MSKKKAILFKNKGGVLPDIYDDAFRVYSFRQIFNGWDKAIMRIRRKTDDVERNVFLDGNGEVSLNSLTSLTSVDTPDSPDVTFDDFATGTATHLVSITNQNNTNTYDSADRLLQSVKIDQPKVYSISDIVKRGGKFAVDFEAVDRFMLKDGLDGFSEMDDTENFTTLSVTNNDTSNNVSAVWCSANTSSVNIRLFHDTRTGATKRGLLVNSSGQGAADLLSAQDTPNQALLTAVVNGGLNTCGFYYNGTAQNINVNWSGTYVNDKFRLGVGQLESNELTGTFQEMIMYPTDKTADLTEIHDDINAYYSIY